MSTGLECAFLEITRNNWYYLLENSGSDGFTSWMNNATAYGPFPSFDEARVHLRSNHANPGGYLTEELPEDCETLIKEGDTRLRRLIDESVKPDSGSRHGSFMRRY